MKKLIISMFSLFLIFGTSEINACATCGCQNNKIEQSETKNTTDNKLVCTKTGKICEKTCENKKKGTCCMGGKKKSCSKSTNEKSCSKSTNNSGFNFTKSNNYGNTKSTCTKSAKKKCCKKTKALKEKTKQDNSEEDTEAKTE